MGWSRTWHKLATSDSTYDEDIRHDGAAAYQLGIGGPRGGGIVPVFVGGAKDARAALRSHALERSWLKAKIRAAFRQGDHLYYRVHPTDDEGEAAEVKFLELGSRRFPWNQRGDGGS